MIRKYTALQTLDDGRQIVLSGESDGVPMSVLYGGDMMILWVEPWWKAAWRHLFSKDKVSNDE